ncbi:hypothetical protein CPAV1605_12 [seawater metagenome]|uniref:Uncharacterized protein n=1 Tax=seawater metagenome TaxID=1561972 RepID=A0A5E8CL14_9ZZZZ
MDIGFYNKYIAFSNSYLLRYVTHQTIKENGINNNLDRNIRENLKKQPEKPQNLLQPLCKKLKL